MRPAIKSDRNEHYEHFLICTDNALVALENAESILRDKLVKHHELNQESIGPPKFYLGSLVSMVTLDNGVEACVFESTCQG